MLLRLLTITLFALSLVACGAPTTADTHTEDAHDQAEEAHDDHHDEEDHHDDEDHHGEDEHHDDEDHHDEGEHHDDEHHDDESANMLALPDATALVAGDTPLKVVATTSIIGDVVANVGQDAIVLTTLISPGQDSHSYQAGALDLIAVAEADVVFINGWDLEESLVEDLIQVAENAVIVPISAGITPLEPAGEDAHDHDHGHAVDPHVWFDVHNVMQWTQNVETMLSMLAPEQADAFAEGSSAYQAELETLHSDLEAQFATLTDTQRQVVTTHAVYGYLANAYNLQVIGTVIPSLSTVSEPSAQDLAVLIEDMTAANVCRIYTEVALSDDLAQTVAGELSHCDGVDLVQLNTESLGEAGGPADTYIGMMQLTADKIGS